MTFSSCLDNAVDGLVLDASVAINILASGHSTKIIEALCIPIFMTDIVVGEIQRGYHSGRGEAELLDQIIDEGLLQVVSIEGDALPVMFDLVTGSATETLGDGEAATLALSNQVGLIAAIDEKKAMRVAADRFTRLRIATTVDILAHKSVYKTLGADIFSSAVLNALQLARMQVREHQYDWIASVIGNDNVGNCSSLRRLAKLRLKDAKM